MIGELGMCKDTFDSQTVIHLETLEVKAHWHSFALC